MADFSSRSSSDAVAESISAGDASSCCVPLRQSSRLLLLFSLFSVLNEAFSDFLANSLSRIVFIAAYTLIPSPNAHLTILWNRIRNDRQRRRNDIEVLVQLSSHALQNDHGHEQTDETRVDRHVVLQRRAQHPRQSLIVIPLLRSHIRHLHVREVEHAIVHVLIDQLLDLVHEPLRIHGWRRRLRRARDQQLARLVAIAVRQRHEDVDEVLLLRVLEHRHDTRVEEDELRVGVVAVEGAVTHALRQRDTARHALAYQDVAGMEVGVNEVVHEKHVEEPENAEIRDHRVVGRRMRQIVRERHALLEGLDEERRRREVEVWMREHELVVVLRVITVTEIDPEIVIEVNEVDRLDAEVQLLLHGLGEQLCGEHGRDVLREGNHADASSEEVHQLQVASERLVHVGAFHFDGNPLRRAAETCLVDLRDAPAADGRFDDRVEDLIHGLSQLSLDGAEHNRVVDALGRGMKGAEPLAQLNRENVGTR